MPSTSVFSAGLVTINSIFYILSSTKSSRPGEEGKPSRHPTQDGEPNRPLRTTLPQSCPATPCNDALAPKDLPRGTLDS